MSVFNILTTVVSVVAIFFKIQLLLFELFVFYFFFFFLPVLHKKRKKEEEKKTVATCSSLDADGTSLVKGPFSLPALLLYHASKEASTHKHTKTAVIILDIQVSSDKLGRHGRFERHVWSIFECGLLFREL